MYIGFVFLLSSMTTLNDYLSTTIFFKMSDITALKQEITKRLDCISDPEQLQAIKDMVERLGKLQDQSGQQERPMTRGISIIKGSVFFRKKLNLDKLCEEDPQDNEALKHVVEQAISLIEDWEQENY